MNDNYDTITIFAGSINIPMLDSLVSKNVEAGWKDHKKNNHDKEKDEVDGAKRDLFKVSIGKIFGHCGWL